MDLSLHKSSLILPVRIWKTRESLLSVDQNHAIPLMAVSEPLSGVNLISFSGLISSRSVKTLGVLLRSFWLSGSLLRAVSPPAASLSTHWESHYGGAGAGRGWVCWISLLWTFQNSLFFSSKVSLIIYYFYWPLLRPWYCVTGLLNNKDRQVR